MDALTLSGLLNSRLCHDLISPVGAASNGVEMCVEDPSACDDAMPLIEQSVGMASARLQFYRMAFGSSGAEGECGLSDLERITGAFFAHGKIENSWEYDRLGVSKAMARMVLLLAMLAGESLIIGGALKVSVDGDGRVRVIAEGERVKLKENIEQVLKGEGANVEPDPKSVPAFLLMELVEKTNATILFEESGDQRLVLQLSMRG